MKLLVYRIFIEWTVGLCIVMETNWNEQRNQQYWNCLASKSM